MRRGHSLPIPHPILSAPAASIVTPLLLDPPPSSNPNTVSAFGFHAGRRVLVTHNFFDSPRIRRTVYGAGGLVRICYVYGDLWPSLVSQLHWLTGFPLELLRIFSTRYSGPRNLNFLHEYSSESSPFGLKIFQKYRIIHVIKL